MLNSAEHEILIANKYKNIKKIGCFSGSDKFIMLFFQLINVKMPTTVGILTFMSRKKFMEKHGKGLVTSGPGNLFTDWSLAIPGNVIHIIDSSRHGQGRRKKTEITGDNYLSCVN